jgi:hypothetical protein
MKIKPRKKEERRLFYLAPQPSAVEWTSVEWTSHNARLVVRPDFIDVPAKVRRVPFPAR